MSFYITNEHKGNGFCESPLLCHDSIETAWLNMRSEDREIYCYVYQVVDHGINVAIPGLLYDFTEARGFEWAQLSLVEVVVPFTHRYMELEHAVNDMLDLDGLETELK